MIIQIDKHCTVNQLQDGSVIVTRPSIMGRMNSHRIESPYKAVDIAAWLYSHFAYSDRKFPVIQEVFPLMTDQDREFLMSGITPAEWLRIFPKEDGEDD